MQAICMHVVMRSLISEEFRPSADPSSQFSPALPLVVISDHSEDMIELLLKMHTAPHGTLSWTVLDVGGSGTVPRVVENSTM